MVATSPPAPQVNDYVMEDTIRWGDLDVKVLDILRLQQYQKLELKSGFEFVMIHVSFQNNTSTDQWFPTEPDLFFLSEDGQTYEPVAMEMEKANPYVHRFEPQEEAKATYVYMIPKGQTGLSLSFTYTKNGGSIKSVVYME